MDIDADRTANALLARIEALTRENDALTRSRDGERVENARLSAALGRTEGENAALREALASARAVGDGLAALAVRIDALADQVARSAGAPQQAIIVTPAGRDQAAEQLHAILTSRSWRMMRPMRGLGRVVRRLRG